MRTFRVMLIVLLALATCAGNSAPASAQTLASHRQWWPRLIVPRHTLLDEPVAIRVVGARPGAAVELRLDITAGGATGLDGHIWESRASYHADASGIVDPGRQAPFAGSYKGVDAMGLFWSATTTPQAAGAPRTAWTEEDVLHVITDGRSLRPSLLVRYLLRPGARATTVRERGIVGTFFEAKTRGKHPALLVVSGSDGGEGSADVHAALLASHGYDALAVAYFDPTVASPGLPQSLSLIPLEYFETAIRWLAQQPGVDAHRIGVRGGSRGGELALLLGSRFPRIRAVIAAAPSSVVWGGLPNPFISAWTSGGRPVPFLVPKISEDRTPFEWYLDALATPNAHNAAIPVERINGPVLLLNGRDDQLWPSQLMSLQIAFRLAATHHPYRDERFSLPGNGHIIVLPYEPTTGPTYGGIPADSAHAAVGAWHKTLRFLRTSLGCSNGCDC